MLRCLSDVGVRQTFTSTLYSYYHISAIKLKENVMVLCINVQLTNNNGSVRDVYNEFGLVTARGFSSTQEKAEAVAVGT